MKYELRILKSKNRKKNKSLSEPETAVKLLAGWVISKEIIHIALNYYISLNMAKWIIYGIAVVLLFFSWPLIKREISGKSIVAFLVWSMILFMSAVTLSQERMLYVKYVEKVMVTCYGMYYLGKIWPVRNEYLEYVPYITGAAAIMLGFSGKMVVLKSEYSQNLGYAALAPLCLAIFYFSKGKIMQIIPAMFLGITLLSAGARGPFVCVGLACLMIIAGKMNFRKLKTWFFILLVTALIWYLIGYYEMILWSLLRWFQKKDWNVRVINALLMDSFVRSKGRNVIYKEAIQYIKGNPVGWIGVFRDRQYLFLHSWIMDRKGLDNSLGFYPHNVFLEWILQFGMFIGFFLIVIFMGICIRSLLVGVKDENYYGQMIVLLAIGLFPLLISGSYISSKNFYLLLGFLLRHKNDSKKIQGRKLTECLKKCGIMWKSS